MLLSGKGRTVINSISCQFRRGDVHFCLLKSVGILPLTAQGEIGLELDSSVLCCVKLLLKSSKFSIRLKKYARGLGRSFKSSFQ